MDTDADKDEQHYIDRSKIDFDPDDGLYTGTAVEGTTEIPGPHEKDMREDDSEPDADEQSQQEPERT
jgi:hypothetical protein